MQPAEMVGLDYSEPAVALCQRIHTGAGLRFVHGDAEQLPFDDASYDAVVNVESSHCYGSIRSFLLEVVRVLRPGGHLLFADFRRRRDLDALLAAFDAAGLQCLSQTDITHNIIAALVLDNAHKLAQIRASAPRWLTRMLGEFAGVPGSRIHEQFTSGSTVYLSCVLRKAV
jgi:ubiquinone/menaquinone biosynthesis C-methylase UbiE